MVKVYSKGFCPYCVKAKNLLNDLGVKFEEIDITSTPEMMAELAKKSGMRTVPQIFIGDKCLGGYSEIEKLDDEGKLLDLLK